MTGLSATEAVGATDRAIHDIGSTFMIHDDTAARSADYGYDNPFSFYFAGRGGVLGDVDADVVTAAMGWFQPDMVRTLWEQGVAVAGARAGAHRYGEACAAWGRDHLAGFAGADRLVALAERLVADAGSSGLPLFAGWRAAPRADDPLGRAMQLIHVLREWRGGLHLVATTAAGLSPLEAILTNEGEGQARFFGWPEPYPDCAALKDRHDVAERTTNELAEQVYERALAPGERAELADLAAAAESAIR